jgi:peptidoglycan/LPS O-acetylase OafA/YrhL
VKEYCVRRWRRIFPPFWFALAATVVLTALLPQIFCDSVRPMGQPLDLNPWQWLGNVTLTELWRPYLGGGDTLWILGPAWSLCYEEQFYILCGIALFLAPQRFFLLMAVITVVVLIGVAVAPTLGLSLKGFFLDGRWLMFAAGVLVYWARNYGRPRRSITLLSVCAVALVLGWPGIRILNPYIGLRAIAVAIVFALLLLLIERHDKRLQQKTAGGLVTCCGTMCYSLYLIHWPVVKLVSQGLWRMGVTTPLNTLTITIPACMIASIAVALFFHRKIERRFMHISA